MPSPPRIPDLGKHSVQMVPKILVVVPHNRMPLPQHPPLAIPLGAQDLVRFVSRITAPVDLYHQDFVEEKIGTEWPDLRLKPPPANAALDEFGPKP